MKASERIRLYEWIAAHKNNHGAEKIVTGTYMDLEYIRRWIFDRKDWVWYERLPRVDKYDDNMSMRIFIK